MINKIRNAKEMVIHFLNNRPELRDDDNRLIANIWASEIGKSNLQQMSATDFLTFFSQSKLTSPESIRRSRQKIQEENPHLRGKSYQARHEKAKEVSKLINS